MSMNRVHYGRKKWRTRWPWKWLFPLRVDDRFCPKCGLPYHNGPVPKELAAALKRNTAAKRTWDNFSPSHRREYIEWITQAKQAETRARRLATALEWMAEGKARNWKYMRNSG